MNIKMFKEFAAIGDDYDINRFIEFINMVGYYEGMNDCSYFSDDMLVEEAINFAGSDFTSVQDYLNKYFSWQKCRYMI